MTINECIYSILALWHPDQLQWLPVVRYFSSGLRSRQWFPRNEKTSRFCLLPTHNNWCSNRIYNTKVYHLTDKGSGYRFCNITKNILKILERQCQNLIEVLACNIFYIAWNFAISRLWKTYLVTLQNKETQILFSYPANKETQGFC